MGGPIPAEPIQMILLQLLVVLSPVWAYELVWRDDWDPNATRREMFGLLYAVALMLSFLFSFRHLAHFDLRAVPLLLAILYGGPVSQALTIMLFVLIGYMSGHMWPEIVVAYLPAIIGAFILRRRYHASTIRFKNIMAVILLMPSTLILVAVVQITGRWDLLAPDGQVLVGAITVVRVMAATLAIYIFESFLERRRLAARVLRLQDDLTRADRALAAEHLVARLAHEIRNPLTVINGFVQMLKNDAPTESVSYFQAIEDEVKRVKDLITDLLSFTRDKEGEWQEASINAVIDELQPLLHGYANTNGMTLQCDLAPEVAHFRMNPAEMKQLLLNLFRNSIEAMERGGKVNITTESHEGRVVLRVSDTGLGISEADLPQIFDPFFTTKEAGTGLGLAICRHIVERHRGTINVMSRETEGTMFVATFQT